MLSIIAAAVLPLQFLEVSNPSTVTNANYGCYTTVGGVLSLLSAPTQVTNQNYGDISGCQFNVGAYFEVISGQSGANALGPTIRNENGDGSTKFPDIVSGYGAKFQFWSDLVFNAATFSNTNYTGVTMIGGYGTALLIEGNLQINDAASELSIVNNSIFGTGGPVSLGSNVYGSYLEVAGSATVLTGTQLTAGTLLLQNTAALNISAPTFTAFGVLALTDTGVAFNMSGGTLTIKNNPSIPNTLTNATGVAFNVGGTTGAAFIQTGGTTAITNTSYTQPNPSDGRGAVLSASSFSVGNATFSNTGGQVITPPGTGGFTIDSGGVVSNINDSKSMALMPVIFLEPRLI